MVARGLIFCGIFTVRNVFQEGRGRLEPAQCAQSKRQRCGSASAALGSLVSLLWQQGAGWGRRRWGTRPPGLGKRPLASWLRDPCPCRPCLIRLLLPVVSLSSPSPRPPTLQKRRVGDLLASYIPEDEALMLRDGR